jgi:hypothetical protein
VAVGHFIHPVHETNGEMARMKMVRAVDAGGWEANAPGLSFFELEAFLDCAQDVAGGVDDGLGRLACEGYPQVKMEFMTVGGLKQVAHRIAQVLDLVGAQIGFFPAFVHCLAVKRIKESDHRYHSR